jgi:CheY-like chemotaxis protein
METSTATSTPVIPAIEGALRIMVVDDNVVNQKLMLNILQRRGFEVVIAGNGAEALSLADSVQLDVILMDCQMPILDGYDAARKLREQKRTSRSGTPIPIIALTANSMAEDRERCKEAGMDGFLAKPLNVRQLFSELDQYLGGISRNDLVASHTCNAVS